MKSLRPQSIKIWPLCTLRNSKYFLQILSSTVTFFNILKLEQFVALDSPTIVSFVRFYLSIEIVYFTIEIAMQEESGDLIIIGNCKIDLGILLASSLANLALELTFSLAPNQYDLSSCKFIVNC